MPIYCWFTHICTELILVRIHFGVISFWCVRSISHSWLQKTIKQLKKSYKWDPTEDQNIMLTLDANIINTLQKYIRKYTRTRVFWHFIQSYHRSSSSFTEKAEKAWRRSNVLRALLCYFCPHHHHRHHNHTTITTTLAITISAMVVKVVDKNVSTYSTSFAEDISRYYAFMKRKKMVELPPVVGCHRHHHRIKNGNGPLYVYLWPHKCINECIRDEICHEFWYFLFPLCIFELKISCFLVVGTVCNDMNHFLRLRRSHTAKTYHFVIKGKLMYHWQLPLLVFWLWCCHSLIHIITTTASCTTRIPTTSFRI